ncbi:hypothetical protein [Cryptosporangium arvum]|uniref:hypothetical protein n=1 Tax=Cryptosporangium arvum TaxID=80871 RepID=UPI000684B474|nr:hypothetical protein [Cryptosporangium arvum]
MRPRALPNPGWLPSAAYPDAYPSAGRYAQVLGRATAEVDTVRVTVDGNTRTVPVINGTFAAGLALTGTNVVSVLLVRAISRTGETISEWDGPPRRCAVDPAGTVVVGRGNEDPASCVRARPWK